MFIQKTRSPYPLLSYFLLALFIFFLFRISNLIISGSHYKLILSSLICIFIFISYNFSILTMLILFFTTTLPNTFIMIPGFPETITYLGKGIFLEDIILSSMTAVILFKLLINFKREYYNRIGLSLFVILFLLWLLYEILRNIGIHGLSSVGEFRFQYLVLSIPIYIYFFITNETKQKQLYIMVVIFSLFLPLLSIPIIGYLKGFVVGDKGRYFSSAISLGLLYGSISLYLGIKYKIIRLNNIICWIFILLAGMWILFDSHRSVWMAAISVAIILLYVNEISFKTILKWSLIITFLAFLFIAIASKMILLSTNTRLTEFLYERSGDIFRTDKKYDNTASWRVIQWKMQLNKFYKTPIAGIGFGGYWGSPSLKKPNDIGISPHSLYVQTLVKLGAVGMILYILIVLIILIKLKRIIIKSKFMMDPEKAILITGFVVLISSHIYFIAYTFEYYSLIFVGLSISTFRDDKYREIL